MIDQEMLNRWYKHKSNKGLWIEAQEREAEENTGDEDEEDDDEEEDDGINGGPDRLDDDGIASY